MIGRERIEKREYEILSPFASKAAESRGRREPEEQCAIRTDYQRDRDRIIHSKSFRRLMHKTQVFLAPEGDHFRTRLTHTIEVSQISRTIARALGLNEDLTEAIAMGHDLGHTPFGHNGEKVLDSIHKGGFRHNIQSLRVADVLESGSARRGMNLTMEVRDGILNHTGLGTPLTLEGQIVKISDRVAYINHDIDDALRSGVITADDLPKQCLSVLGETHRARIDTLVTDLINSSWQTERISMSSVCMEHMDLLRDFMFQNVYHNNRVKKDEDLQKVKNIIESLYRYFQENPTMLPEELQRMIPEFGLDEMVKDYIAGMTDRYAMNLYTDLFVPRGWK
ncbi:MAG: deoxyguanosinetriphosphate triphosphohydrolase [Firmicutes bacterium]|nr:deoxyguanosinetriphosphate triphosphohydrolase [Bacillota bacterium]NBI64024.1 deoxyguanosinetriphosphate triphosphohydrolase [Clostridiales bacterium]